MFNICKWFGHPQHELVSPEWIRPMSFTYMHVMTCWCGKNTQFKEVRHSKEMD